jgi:ribosomal protein L11 methyltransferase
LPYRIDITNAPADALDRLMHLGALDVEAIDGRLAAIMPDSVAADAIASTLGVNSVTVSPAVGRDDQSVWMLSPGAVRVGRLLIVPEGVAAPAGALRLIDSAAFGTGLHPTTALCVEALEQALDVAKPDNVLDVGTGSGVLALAALLRGVPRVVALDIDADAIGVAARNARLNGVDDRLHLVHGGPDAVGGTWPLVLANVLAAPLVEMAPVLVRRIRHHGRLVLSGIPGSVASEVEQAYRRLGMRTVDHQSRGGWDVLVLEASW